MLQEKALGEWLQITCALMDEAQAGNKNRLAMEVQPVSCCRHNGGLSRSNMPVLHLKLTVS